tara:strand:- start:43 stop:480 length:438 start_codon:yes stop_codon:yes gene_type:complete
MDKIDCFAYFGIKVKNIRWSWSGLNESGDNRKDSGYGPVAALTIWTDQTTWDKEKRCSIWSTFDQNNEIWKVDKGNSERIKIIKYCIKNLNSEFRPIFVVPMKPGVIDETREAKSHYVKKDRDIWYRITKFDEMSGECKAESFIK